MKARAPLLERRVPPPVVMAGVAATMWVTAPAGEVFGAPAVLPGALAIALGWSLVSWGFVTFRAARTTIDPLHPDRASVLVTHGPFARSRNPMYLGFGLMLVGWAFMVGAPRALFGPFVFFAWVWHFQVKPEERALRARFGEAWVAYASRVRRWL